MRRLAMCILVSLACLSSAGAQAIDNPGFEPGADVVSTTIAGWRAFGDANSARLVADRPFKGTSALELKRVARMAGVGQTIDAQPYHGRIVRYSAQLRGSGLRGGNAGIYLTGQSSDGTTSLPVIASYGGRPLDDDWREVGVYAFVSPATARLTLGVLNTTAGTMWADEAALRTAAPGTAAGPADPAIAAFFREAVARVRQSAYFADRVHWDALASQTDAELPVIGSIGQARELLAAVVATLGDGHSHLVSPAVTAADATSGPVASAIRSQAFGRVGYLRVPGFHGANGDAGDAFADQLGRHLASAVPGGACAWIVDLRTNTGGNMYPMLAGLSPLLGDGTFGHFVGKEGRTPWSVSGGKALEGDRVHARLGSPTAAFTGPVAVLMGPATASSGEVVALSFGQRPRTRSFGEPTRGATTANRSYALADGSRLALTVARLADAGGRVVDGKLVPDEVVVQTPRASSEATAATAATAARDDAVDRALAWLLGHGDCR